LLLNKDEDNFVWNRIYSEFHFNPSINKSVLPFELNCNYQIYDISKLTEKNIDDMDDIITNILIKCTEETETVYALDWQHSSFKFNPRNKEEQKSIYVKDDKYFGGGYNAYFPSYYPDGDYYFFIASDFSFGYLGHPWQNKVWIFGEKLIYEFNKVAYQIGFEQL